MIHNFSSTYIEFSDTSANLWGTVYEGKTQKLVHVVWIILFTVLFCLVEVWNHLGLMTSTCIYHYRVYRLFPQYNQFVVTPVLHDPDFWFLLFIYELVYEMIAVNIIRHFSVLLHFKLFFYSFFSNRNINSFTNISGEHF